MEMFYSLGVEMYYYSPVTRDATDHIPCHTELGADEVFRLITALPRP